jgi:hypothetical protein
MCHSQLTCCVSSLPTLCLLCQLGLINSDGSSGSETSADTRAGAMAGYSPFMGTPWGNSLYTASDVQGPPTLELPNSPMSPGKTGPVLA